MIDSFGHWLSQLRATPEPAIDDLVRGRVALGGMSRASLGEILSEIARQAQAELDEGLSLWLEQRVGQSVPAGIDTEVWPIYLQDLFRAIAGLGLAKVEHFLRDRLFDLQVWLGPLRKSEAVDPQAAYLNALAWAKTNQNLERRWRKLVVGREPLPAYYREIGLLGLRRQRDEEAKLPPKAPFTYLAALVDLADTAGTNEAPALTETAWTRLTRAMLSGYRLSNETWAREFEPVLATRRKAKNGRVWLTKLIPELNRESYGKKPSRPVASSANFRQVADAIVPEVRRLGPAAVGHRLQLVVEEHRKYAASTNDPHFLVRTFNRLAEAAKESDPDWAVARAEEALVWDRGNARNWTVVARCLWGRAERLHLRDRHSEAETAANEAFDVLWESRFRFAYNAVVRTELARLHRDAGDLEAAEAIYREASDDFPEDIFCRTGLAEVLTEQNRLPEAEAVYRKAMRELPADSVCLCGLANVLRLIGGDSKTEESKRLFRRVIQEFPDEAYAYTGLAEFLFDESAATQDKELREESRALFQQAADLHNNYAASFLRHFDQRWQQRVAQKARGKPAAAEQEHEQSTSPVVRATPNVDQMGPAERLGRALLAQWHGKRSQDQTKRAQHFAEAEWLLALDDSLTGECYAAFIEARGLLLLARDKFQLARQYFEEQLQRAAPKQPLGLRLGLLDARQRLDEPLDADDESLLSELGPDASLLVSVLQVVRLLRTKGDQELLRRLLLEIFPRVRELAAQLPGEEDESHSEATPDRMLASLLQKQFFEPVGIESVDDLADTSKVSQLDNPFRLHGRELSSAIEKIILSLAA